MRTHRQDGSSRRAGVAAAIVRTALAVMLAAGLPSCTASTTGKEIAFSAAAAGGTSTGTPPTATFTTYAGWSVTLSQALVLMGPLYFYEGAPQASRWKRLLPISSAYACPTHAQYNKGTVLGEVLQQYVVDLLGQPTALGQIMGFAGTCRTVELHLHPHGEMLQGPSATDVALLQGHSVRLEGTATKADMTVPFIARLTIPDEGLMRIVESIAAEVELGVVGQQAGSLQLEALLDMWLATVQFDSLTRMEGASYVFSDDDQAWAALARGVRARSSYRVSWRAP